MKEGLLSNGLGLVWRAVILKDQSDSCEMSLLDINLFYWTSFIH